MTSPKRANDLNLLLLCKSEPVLHIAAAGYLDEVNMEPITGTEHGDTPGFINWDEVSAVTWRYAPLGIEGVRSGEQT